MYRDGVLCALSSKQIRAPESLVDFITLVGDHWDGVLKCSLSDPLIVCLYLPTLKGPTNLHQRTRGDDGNEVSLHVVPCLQATSYHAKGRRESEDVLTNTFRTRIPAIYPSHIGSFMRLKGKGFDIRPRIAFYM